MNDESCRTRYPIVLIHGAGFRGISHLDAIDLRRAPLSRRKGEGVSDICRACVQIAEDLKRRGL